MQTRRRNLFTTVRTEGAILPPDIVQRVADGDKDLGGLTPDAYHLAGREKINEVIERSWTRLLGAWAVFRAAKEKLPSNDLGTSLTRDRWLLILFQELGYGRLTAEPRAIEIEGKTYPISHAWQHAPIHLVGCRVDLDRRTKGVAGAATQSPHSLVQEFLNRSPDRLWGFLSNGLLLRILRDNVSLVRQAHVEFDLQAMMDGEVYSDFVLLWLLCHQSRVEGERPEQCWLEQWSQAAQQRGTRALDDLRKGVEDAIAALGHGFLAHAANEPLRERLRSGALSPQDYYRQLLRLVYRLLFLFVAEDRGLLLDPKADAAAKSRFEQFYSTARLRRLAERRRGSRHVDLHRGLRIVMDHLGRDAGCPPLGLPALGGFLWSETAAPDLDHADISNADFLAAIRHLAFITDAQARRPVDFKNLGSEELGSIYESLLELHPEIGTNAATFELKTASGHERKTTGSYYTPTSLITCLLDSALDPVLDEAVKQPDPERALLDLTICDPACGSGHFLVAAAHRLAKRLAAVRTGEEEPAPEPLRTALRDVIGRCIHGVDLNEMAVELCKFNLWLEALEPGRPLSFLDHHIQRGNSLLGATPALLAQGIPDEAFKPIEGDDKDFCKEWRRRNKQERETGQYTLFDAAAQPWERLGDLATAMASLDAIDDTTIEGVRRRQERYAQAVASQGYLFNTQLADLWCAAFVWKKRRTDVLLYPITDEVFRKARENPHSVPLWMREEIKRLREQYEFFHWHLAFPGVFRVPVQGEAPDNPQTGLSGGFSVVLGNPPWEHTEIKDREWFATRRPDIANAANAAQRSRLIEALREQDPALHAEFIEASREQEGLRHLITSTGRFPLCARGRINTYAIFAELNRSLVGPRGRAGFIVPSGIATDDTTKFFFRDLMQRGSLASLFDFENKNIFPEVHSSYKFSLLTLAGTGTPVRGAVFVFFAHEVAELHEADRRFTLTADDIALLNPNTGTCAIFRSQNDAELAKAIYRRVPVLIREGPPEDNPWGLTFKQGLFNMATGSGLFRTQEQLEAEGWELRGNVFRRDAERHLPLYEAKMVHQFTHRYGDYADKPEDSENTSLPDVPTSRLQKPGYVVLPRYWVPESAVDDALVKRDHEGKTLWRWDRQWLLGWRDITNAGNERTVVAAVSMRAGCGDTFLLMFPSVRPLLCSGLLSNLNSFALDYVARQKLGGIHMKYHVFKQLPVLPPTALGASAPWDASIAISEWVTPRVVELTCTSHDIAAFGEDMGCPGGPYRWDDERRFLMRCELDAAFFHLYLGSEAEWQREPKSLTNAFPTPRAAVEHIMDTFPIVRRDDEKRHGDYRTKRVILEIYDAMSDAIRTGQLYQTRLDPPPADARVAHSPGAAGSEAG